jgi:hypothetical protein
MRNVMALRYGSFRDYARRMAPANEITGEKYNFQECLELEIYPFLSRLLGRACPLRNINVQITPGGEFDRVALVVF